MARPQIPPTWSLGTARLLVELMRARLAGAGSGPPPRTVPVHRPSDGDLAGVADAARWHRVAGPVREGLRGSALSVPPHVDRVLTDHVRFLRTRHLAVTATLGVAAPVLEPIGPWAVLKGPVLAAQQSDLGPRAIGDLDLLVDPSDLPEHLAALTAAGFETEERNWRLLSRLPFGQVHLRPIGAARRVAAEVDLHWHVVHHPSARRTLTLPTADLLGRRRATVLGGVPAWTLDPVDVVVGVAVHATLGGLGHLGWLVDLDRALAACGVGPDAVLARAEGLDAALPTAVALRCARSVLGGDESAPRRRSAWTGAIRAVRPAARAGRHPRGPFEAVARLVAGATRRDTGSSVVALLGRSTRSPLALVPAALRIPPLRRLAPLMRYAGRLYPGRALGLAHGTSEEFRPVGPTRRGPRTARR